MNCTRLVPHMTTFSLLAPPDCLNLLETDAAIGRVWRSALRATRASRTLDSLQLHDLYMIQRCGGRYEAIHSVGGIRNIKGTRGY